MNPMNVYPANSTVPIFFSTYGKTNGESITLTGLAVTDIEIYKGTSMTQRSSDSGYVLLDTDGIDIDSITGIHGFSIDLSDNGDAGFYAVGSIYHVVVSAVTVDSQTVNFVADRFRIVTAESITGKPKVDVDAWLGTAAATPTVAGVPEVDVTHFAGTAATVAAGIPETKVASIAANAVSATAIAADAITAAKIADSAIDRATFAVDTGLQTIRSNTAQSGAGSTITLDAGASATDDIYKGKLILLTGGTGVGGCGLCVSYNGTTKVAGMGAAWNTSAPDATTTFAILPWGQSDVGSWNGTAIPAVHTAGYPIVTVKDGTGTGELDTASGVVIAKDHTGANLATASALDAVDNFIDTEITDIQARLPAALGANGNIKADVRDFNGTAATVAAGIPEVKVASIAANAVSASALATDAVTEITDAILALVIETGYTLKQTLRLIAAAVAGKVSGGPGSPVFRSLDDSANRITATASVVGDRTAVTHNA